MADDAVIVNCYCHCSLCRRTTSAVIKILYITFIKALSTIDRTSHFQKNQLNTLHFNKIQTFFALHGVLAHWNVNSCVAMELVFRFQTGKIVIRLGLNRVATRPLFIIARRNVTAFTSWIKKYTDFTYYY